MHEFMQNFKELVLFNTIANYTANNPDGLTHSDIIAMDPHIPRTRISRVMSKLTNEGYLHEKEIKTEIGRPRKYYSLTDKGTTYHNKLKENMQSLYVNVRERLARDLAEFDFQKMPKGRFDYVTHILANEEDSIEEKREKLIEIKEELQSKLEQVTDALKKLK